MVDQRNNVPIGAAAELHEQGRLLRVYADLGGRFVTRKHFVLIQATDGRRRNDATAVDRRCPQIAGSRYVFRLKDQIEELLPANKGFVWLSGTPHAAADPNELAVRALGDRLNEAAVCMVSVKNNLGDIVELEQLVEALTQPRVPCPVVTMGLGLRRHVLDGVAALLDDGSSLAHGGEYRFDAGRHAPGDGE